jgi:hypothetical protein
MNTMEVVQPDILAKHSETFPRRAAQVGGTVGSTPFTLPVRAFRAAHADVVRAAQIILEWREYLPDDCVKAMVASGWHFTV